MRIVECRFCGYRASATYISLANQCPDCGASPFEKRGEQNMTDRQTPFRTAQGIAGDLVDKIAEALEEEREESTREGQRTAKTEGFAEWEWELLYGTADSQEPPAGAKITLEWARRESPSEMIRRLTRERDDAQEVARIRLDTIDRMTETLGKISEILED